MKWNELTKRLKKEGWRFFKNAKGSHEFWYHPEKPGIYILVAQHGSQEIGTGLANKILKQAGLK